MPLLTTDRVMELLDITDDALRPLAQAHSLAFQSWLAQELRNYFHTEDDILASTISFSGQVITDSDSNFVEAGFTDDMDIHIEGSKRNDGIFLVKTVAAGTLTLDGDLHADNFNTEAAANSIYITRMQWPQGIELAAAKAIEHDMGRTRAINEATTSAADLSAYPEGLMKKFEPWRKWGLLSQNVPIVLPGSQI